NPLPWGEGAVVLHSLNTDGGRDSAAVPTSTSMPKILPLPKGEGWGEGKGWMQSESACSNQFESRRGPRFVDVRANAIDQRAWCEIDLLFEPTAVHAIDERCRGLRFVERNFCIGQPTTNG